MIDHRRLQCDRAFIVTVIFQQPIRPCCCLTKTTLGGPYTEIICPQAPLKSLGCSTGLTSKYVMSCALTFIYMRFCGSTVVIENILKIVKNVVDMQRTQKCTQFFFYQLTICFNVFLKNVILLQIRVHRFDSGTRLQNTCYSNRDISIPIM